MGISETAPISGYTHGHGAHLAGAEVRGLVHVDPQAVPGRHVMEGGQLAAPPLPGPQVQEVRVVHRPRPHLGWQRLLDNTPRLH